MNKRLITLLLALCLMLSLVACGGSTTEEAPEQDVVEEETMPEEEVTEGDVTEEAPEVEETEEEPAPETQPEVEQAPAEVPEQKPAETQPEVETPPAASAGVDLEAFYNELYAKLYPLDSEGFGTGPFVQDLGTMPELLENYYPGLAALCKQVHVYMPGMSGVPYEVVLVEANSVADVDAVKALMQARIDTELANQMNYPMVLENWEFNAKIVANGAYVMMAVTDIYADYVDAFNDLF